ncbi:hypothetical protein [Bradyrhizobium yuanmingense]|uniref:Uncharacterized protein n=1 Tax=Bradyrhizobium yuanmingense TaxID=108015 RepID=A0ABV4G929_9BRAD|nr:hypothetical protein [Bradyrhizobium yuanmingense]
MLTPGKPQLRDCNSKNGWIAFARYQLSGCDLSPIVGSPRQHPAVGADIGRIDHKRLRKVGQCSFLKSKVPGGFGVEDEAMSGRRGRSSDASICVFERLSEVLGSQRLGREAFERDMRTRPDKRGDFIDHVKNHAVV